ncbi:MAG: (deoxy)nucleoside triphosphate pyrophosphohydrolase [Phycisphaeraceae bacterium]
MAEPCQQVDVAIGVLVEQRDAHTCVLIARRKHDAVLGGYWELPGGKIERGESPAQCLIREYEEELGVTVETTSELPVITFHYDHAQVRLHPFFCRRLAGSAEPRNLHVADHRWVKAANLLDYTFPPANDALMRQVRDILV